MYTNLSLLVLPLKIIILNDKHLSKAFGPNDPIKTINNSTQNLQNKWVWFNAYKNSSL